MTMRGSIVDCARTASVVIAGDDVYEDLFTASLELQDILASAGFAVRVRMGMASAAADAQHSDLVVMYRAAGEFELEKQRALAAAVRNGCGLIALHSSNVFTHGAAGPSERPAYDLIGSRFLSHGPKPHESRFTVRLDPDDEITRGIAAFDITHEHYATELAPDVMVAAWRDDAGRAEPLLYTRRVGSGRVCYLQLGHDMRVWSEPAVRKVIARAAAWAQRPTRGRAHTSTTHQGGAAMASPSTAGGTR